MPRNFILPLDSNIFLMKAIRMKKIIALSLILFSITSSAETKVDCSYNMFGAPFASMQLTYDDNGILGPEVVIDMYGKKTFESATPAPRAAGEIEHFLLSKELSEQPIEVIIFAEAQAKGNSKMINPQAPIGKDSWGNCASQ